jgi:dTDP-4-amino-4,6-dideoxygalactose transaminase
VIACLAEGWLTMGPRTQSLEGALAEELGAPSVACVSSGSAALHLACRAIGLGDGDEVVMPALSSVAPAAAVRWTGATPVFADVASPQAPNMDVAGVEAALTDRTKAVVGVHLWGYQADAAALRELCDARGLVLIEDAADAVGAGGTTGHLGCLSFGPGKQLELGEGGAVITADADMEATVRSLRSHAMTSVTWDRHRGYAQSYDVVDVGYNFRIDEPRAALGIARLPRLRAQLERRRAVAAGYRERLGAIDTVELMWDAAAAQAGSNLVFPVLAADREARDRARAALEAAGIETRRYPAVHTLTAYGDGAGGPLPAAEEAADRHYCLPVSAALEDADLDAIAAEVTSVG